MNQRKVGIILSYMTQIFGILSSVIYTPIMLNLLGQSEYGLYSLVSSTVSYLTLLSFGFSGCYLYFYNKFSAKNDKDEIAKFNGIFLIIFLIISLICIIIGCIMVANIEVFFGNGLNINEYRVAKILMLIMIFNMAFSFPNNVFTSAVDAQEKFIFTNSITLATNIITIIINLFVLFMGYGSIGLVCVSLVFTVIKLVIYVYYCVVQLRMKFCFTKFPRTLVKSMFSFTFFIFLNQLINQLNGQLDKVLLGRFCGASVVAIYTIGSTINCYYQQLATSITSVFGPQINQIEANSINIDNEELGNKKMTDIFIKVSRLQFFILMLVLSGFIFLGKKFIELWIGTGYEISYYIALGLMITSSVSYFQSLAPIIQRAKFKHKSRAIVYLIMAIGNIFLSIPLLIKYGAFGAAIGTMIVNILGDWFFLNYYFHARMGLDMIRFWKELIQLIKPISIAFIIGVIINQMINVSSWKELIFSGILYTIIYIILFWICGFNNNEKQIFSNMLLKPIKNLNSKGVSRYENTV